MDHALLKEDIEDEFSKDVNKEKCFKLVQKNW